MMSFFLAWWKVDIGGPSSRKAKGQSAKVHKLSSHSGILQAESELQHLGLYVNSFCLVLKRCDCFLKPCGIIGSSF
jgi:hypothetical protein